VPNTEIKKNNFSLNANYQLTDRIKIGATANYIVTDAPNLPGGPSGGRAAGVMLQFLWFGRQVDINELKNNRNVNWNNSYYSNPYWNAYYNTTSQQRNRLIGDIHLEAQLAKGLDFRFRSGTDYYNDRRKYKIKYGTNGTPFGSYAEDGYTVNESNTEAILHFTRNLTSDFSLDALAGFNVRNRTYENNYQKAPRLAVPDLYTLTNSRDAFSNHIQELSELETTLSEPYEMQEKNISTFCEGIMDKIKGMTQEDVTLTVNAPKLNVKINPEQLERVLLHLLENAAEYTPAGGKIWLDFKKRGAHTHQFIISDTGCGIPEEQRENIFKPFTEVKDLTQGDGLGLPICSLIATKMNGSLTLDSSYNKGARFVLELHA
jgi:two-component sensor histidine kinase